ncbi:hypothetical protein [Streptomyces fungicidicus]|uniref:hypothetical protein n=1 Tax=Streptomyces fungicidicus TaxID=68203 RepID=UPI00365359C3
MAPLREQGRREARLEEAMGILAGLRHGDARLTLSVRDVHRTLTAELPVVMKYPAGVIAYRLRELVPPPLPLSPRPHLVPTARTPSRTVTAASECSAPRPLAAAGSAGPGR